MIDLEYFFGDDVMVFVDGSSSRLDAFLIHAEHSLRIAHFSIGHFFMSFTFSSLLLECETALVSHGDLFLRYLWSSSIVTSLACPKYDHTF